MQLLNSSIYFKQIMLEMIDRNKKEIFLNKFFFSYGEFNKKKIIFTNCLSMTNLQGQELDPERGRNISGISILTVDLYQKIKFDSRGKRKRIPHSFQISCRLIFPY